MLYPHVNIHYGIETKYIEEIRCRISKNDLKYCQGLSTLVEVYY
jgi:hypothetical protein